MSSKPKVQLEQWQIVTRRDKTCLIGIVSGHPKIKDGTNVLTTEAIVNNESTEAETLNTIYTLGQELTHDRRT